MKEIIKLNKVEMNCFAWFEIPVRDLNRAVEFYEGVLRRRIEILELAGEQIAIINHDDECGGALVVRPEEIIDSGGILLYLNVEGRLHAACEKVTQLGGSVKGGPKPAEELGFGALVIDSEGNRIALRSSVDR